MDRPEAVDRTRVAHYQCPCCRWYHELDAGPGFVDRICAQCGARGLYREPSAREFWQLRDGLAAIQADLKACLAKKGDS